MPPPTTVTSREFESSRPIIFFPSHGLAEQARLGRLARQPRVECHADVAQERPAPLGPGEPVRLDLDQSVTLELAQLADGQRIVLIAVAARLKTGHELQD